MIYLPVYVKRLPVSESDEHRQLVEMMARGFVTLIPGIRIFADLPGGFDRPPKIAGFIPDVYGRCQLTGRRYIGEAKTWVDLETKRSQRQIIAFIEQVNKQPAGVFCLAGCGETAMRAKTILRFLLRQRRFAATSVQVFDGLDYWALRSGEGTVWHLC